jgi:DNA-binding SARP family transcriptional activator/tetratricopeptide (TPR) repeat protein
VRLRYPPDRRPRCVLVVAAAGYGKTTALRAAVGSATATWLPAADLPELLAGGLPDVAARGAQWVVLDDLPQLSGDLTRRLLAGAARLAEPVSIALASRWPLGTASSRWRGRGTLAETGPADLALPVEQIAALARGYGLSQPSLPERLFDATAGWPALVHLAAETLATGGVPDGALLPALVEPGSALAGYLNDEVLAGLPEAARRLLREVARFAPVTVGLCEALGHRRAEHLVALLSRTGLVAPRGVGAGGLRRVVPVLAAVAGRERRLATARQKALAAATWYAHAGPPIAAARAWREAGEPARCVRILADHGDDMIGRGDAPAVVELVESLSTQDVAGAGTVGDRLSLLLGDALRTTGDVAAAQKAYAAVADAGEEWTSAVAWRMGLVHYLRGEPRAALDAFARAAPGAGGGTDDALLLAWTATAQLMAGEAGPATRTARQALAAAHAAADQRALATAHIALAVCLAVGGEPAASATHHAEALRIAERIGDVLLITRIQTNRTHTLLAGARYPEALDAAQQAVRSADAAGHANLLSIAACNEALVLGRLGRYEESVARYEQVIQLSQRMGSRRVAAALLGLGDVHSRRGWAQQARAAYEEALRIVGPDGDNQALVLALAGLARVLVGAEPDTAARYAAQAVRRAGADGRIAALLSQGWVVLHGGDRTRAARLADEAAGLARTRRERAGLAEALELRAAAEADPVPARTALTEAYAIWRDAGADVDADRVLVGLGRLPGAGTDDRVDGLLATERLAAAGIGQDGWRPAGPAGTAPGYPPVRIQVLGRFEVLVGGQRVAASGWQSRKARDLLRILVARRGRPVPRGELSELLWPDDDATRTGHRLSVLLSILRAVLDPDRARPADHFVRADQSSVALDMRRVQVDVDDFLADVRHAVRLAERGATTEARTLLAAADQAYAGDAFSDEPYAEWTTGLREEARAAYLRCLRLLAALARAGGETDQTLAHLLQILRQDRYDEAAHREIVATLVRAGRHGEARRALHRYVEAMRDIGVRPPPGDLLARR